MKRMIGLVAACLMVTCAQSQSWLNKGKEQVKTKGWITDFVKAQSEAQAFKQPIFAFFTGSDWCGWCVRLHKEVLSTKDFENFAADNLILFEADFPRGKKVDDKVMAQNRRLAEKYEVRGYPTVYLLDAEGKQLGQTGYKEGGGKAYVEHLKEMLQKAGLSVADKDDAKKAISAYEKMKAEKAAKQ